MFTSKRKEALRYTFNKPVDCIFEIVEINGTTLKSNTSHAKLIDLSKNGCRIETKLNLNSKTNRIKVSLTLRITDKDIQVVGELKWQMSSLSYHSYGILFNKNNEVAPTLIEELKILAKGITNPQKVG